MTDELPKIVLDEEQGRPTQASSSRSDQETRRRVTGEPDDEQVAAGGPVAFRSTRTRIDADKSNPTQDQDT